MWSLSHQSVLDQNFNPYFGHYHDVNAAATTWTLLPVDLAHAHLSAGHTEREQIAIVVSKLLARAIRYDSREGVSSRAAAVDVGDVGSEVNTNVKEISSARTRVVWQQAFLKHPSYGTDSNQP